MERQRDKLIELMDSKFGLLDKLLNSNTLTKSEIAKIKAETTMFSGNEILLNHIFQKEKEQDLITALLKSGQNHVVNWVRGNGEYETDFGLDWPLTEEENKILDTNRESLVDTIDTSELLYLLYSKGVVNMRQRDFMRSKPTNYECNEVLIDIITRSSRKSFFLFINCLRESNQVYIADILENRGAIVRIHATLESENLTEAETQIVNEITNFLSKKSTSLEQANRLLSAVQLKVVAVKRGQSIVLYISCIKEEEFIYLCQTIDDLEMKTILQQLFSLLVEHLKIKVNLLMVKIHDKDITSAKQLFQSHSCSAEGRTFAARYTQVNEEPVRMGPDLGIIQEPKCLIETGPDGKLAVNKSVVEELKSIEGHVVVVSIAGPYRTGKSFLMNKLHGQNKGFTLGSTIQAHTKGIWIWVREHPRQKDNYLVLLDTEGLGDVEKGDENHDYQILCLAILLASTFVYNVMGVIGNDAIQKLHFITELAKHIQVRSGDCGEKKPGSTGNDYDFDFYFPDFVYAIRDFTLELEIDGREVTSDEYLEHTLTMKPGDRPEVKNFNKIRSCIRKYFRNRKCFTFIPPVPGKCRRLDEVSDDKLLPEFRQEAEAFVKYIHGQTPVKKINGIKLTGRMFASLVEAYTEQILTETPYVENAVDTMARLVNSNAKQEAVELYYSLMIDLLEMPVLEDAEFTRCHSECLTKAINLFLSKALFDQNQVYQRQMNEELEKRYIALVNMNETYCRERCQEVLNELYEPIQKKLGDGNYTISGGFGLYQNDMNKLGETYKQKLGHLATKMPHVLLEFLHSRQTEEDAILRSDEMVSAKERECEAERQKAVEIEQRMIEAERQVALQQQMLEQEKLALEQNIAKLKAKMHEDAAASEKHYKETMEKRLDEMKRLHSERFQCDAESLKAQITALQNQLSQQQSDRSRSGEGCTIQ